MPKQPSYAGLCAASILAFSAFLLPAQEPPIATTGNPADRAMQAPAEGAALSSTSSRTGVGVATTLPPVRAGQPDKPAAETKPEDATRIDLAQLTAAAAERKLLRNTTPNPDAPGQDALDPRALELQKPLMEHEAIHLWGKEDFLRRYPEETLFEGDIRRGGGAFKHVSYPSIYVFKAIAPNSSGTAMIICPGGAYLRVGVQGMGVTQSHWLNEQGITTFVLKYRTIPGAKLGTDGTHNPEALDDVQRAIRLVRSRAEEFGIDPHKIGVTGESAGANLILNLLMAGGPGDSNAADPIDRESSRPDFAMLLGTWPGIQKWDYFRFRSDMPPTFIAHVRDDNVAPFDFANYVYDAMVKANVNASFYIYENGGHTSFTFHGKNETLWPDYFLPWLKENRLITDPLVATTLTEKDDSD